MKLWSWHSAEDERSETSAFTGILPRVREMRTNEEWPPATPESAIEGRKERVKEVRRRIVYAPQPVESRMEFPPYRVLWWRYGLPLMLITGLGIALILWVYLFP